MSTGKTLLSPEEYFANLTYEITLSPPDDYATVLKGHPEAFYVVAFIENMTHTLWNELNGITESYYFCTEISRTGRPHLHGTIKFKNLKQIFLFITRFIHKYHNTMQIAMNINYAWNKPQIEAEADCKSLGFDSVVERPIYWIRYIKKQAKLFKAMKINPVITSDDSIVPEAIQYDITSYL